MQINAKENIIEKSENDNIELPLEVNEEIAKMISKSMIVKSKSTIN